MSEGINITNGDVLVFMRIKGKKAVNLQKNICLGIL